MKDQPITTSQMDLLPSAEELTPVTTMETTNGETMVSSAPRRHLLPAVYAKVHQIHTDKTHQIALRLEIWPKTGGHHEEIILQKLIDSIVLKVQHRFHTTNVVVINPLESRKHDNLKEVA